MTAFGIFEFFEEFSEYNILVVNNLDNLLNTMPLLGHDFVGIIVFCIFYLYMRNSSDGVKRRVLYILCVINLVFYLIDQYDYYMDGNTILTLLPLQLCDMAVILIPAALKFKKQLFFDFVFFISVPGAISALLIPSGDFSFGPFSLMTISFFMFHFMIVAIPILMASWGICSFTPTIKKALRLSAALLVVAGIMHMINLFLGAAFHVEADYCFTIIKYSAPGNPVFELLSKIIPYDYFYLIPALSILYVYMLIIFIIASLRNRASSKLFQPTNK